MALEEPYKELSDDEIVAFMQLEKEFRSDKFRSDMDFRYLNDIITVNYMRNIASVIRELNVDALSPILEFFKNGGQHEDFPNFLRAVDNTILRIRVAKSRNRNAMVVGLSEGQKTKIHQFIEKIRTEVAGSAATEDKKDSIFNALKHLAAEVSKNRTGYERFADLARSLAGLSGYVAEKGARAWWPLYGQIMDNIDDAKEAELQLSKQPEIKKIAGPKKQLPKPD